MAALLVFLMLCAAFAAGFVLRSQPALMTALGFPELEGQASDGEAGSGKSTFDSVSARVSNVDGSCRRSSAWMR